MSDLYVAMSAWREILARVFDGFTAQHNVSPEWLVNPSTGRRLKLDVFYPEAGFAVRFAGLTAKGQGRQSDLDILEQQQRDQNRAELCRMHGVQLLLVDPQEEMVKQLDSLTRLLTRASRMLAQGDRPAEEKARWMPALFDARGRSSDLRSRVKKNPEQMTANLAEAWRDRELAEEAKAEPLPLPPATVFTAADLTVGQRVEHERFGAGVITALTGEGAVATVSILFDGGQERTFLIPLIQDKLRIVA